MKIDIISIVVGLRDHGIQPNAIMPIIDKILDAEIDRLYQRNDNVSSREIALAHNNADHTINRMEDRYPGNRLDLLV